MVGTGGAGAGGLCRRTWTGERMRRVALWAKDTGEEGVKIGGKFWDMNKASPGDFMEMVRGTPRSLCLCVPSLRNDLPRLGLCACPIDRRSWNGFTTLEATQGLKSISHRCHPILVAFVWEVAEETIDLPLVCLHDGSMLPSHAGCLLTKAHCAGGLWGEEDSAADIRHHALAPGAPPPRQRPQRPQGCRRRGDALAPYDMERVYADVI